MIEIIYNCYEEAISTDGGVNFDECYIEDIEMHLSACHNLTPAMYEVFYV